jgi:hypothetical protein
MTPIKIIPPEVLALQLQVAALRSALLTVLQLDPGRTQLEHVGAALSAAPAVVSQLVEQNEQLLHAVRLLLPCLENWVEIADEEDQRETDYEALAFARPLLES